MTREDLVRLAYLSMRRGKIRYLPNVQVIVEFDAKYGLVGWDETLRSYVYWTINRKLTK